MVGAIDLLKKWRDMCATKDDCFACKLRDTNLCCISPFTFTDEEIVKFVKIIESEQI